MHARPQEARESWQKARGGPTEYAYAVAFGKLAAFSPTSRAEAVEALESALSGGYALSDSAFWLSVAYMECGRYAEARRTLGSLVREDPSSEEAAALLEVFKERVRAEGASALATAGVVALGLAAVYLLLRWRGSHAPPRVPLYGFRLPSGLEGHGAPRGSR
jgi:hypothetical protein